MITRLCNDKRINFLDKRKVFFSPLGGSEDFSHGDIKAENLERDLEMDDTLEETKQSLEDLSDTLDKGNYGDLLSVARDVSRDSLSKIRSLCDKYSVNVVPILENIILYYEENPEEDIIVDDKITVTKEMVKLVKYLKEKAEDSKVDEYGLSNNLVFHLENNGIIVDELMGYRDKMPKVLLTNALSLLSINGEKTNFSELNQINLDGKKVEDFVSHTDGRLFLKIKDLSTNEVIEYTFLKENIEGSEVVDAEQENVSGSLEEPIEKLPDAEQITEIAKMTPANLKDTLAKVDIWKNAKNIADRFSGLYKSGFNLVSSMIELNNDTQEIVISLPKDHIIDPRKSFFKRFDFQDNFITINDKGKIHLHSPDGSLSTELNTISFDEIKNKIYEDNRGVQMEEINNPPQLVDVEPDFFEQEKLKHVNRWTADMKEMGCTVQTDTIVYTEKTQSFSMKNEKGKIYEFSLDMSSQEVTVTCDGKIVHYEKNVTTLAEFTSQSLSKYQKKRYLNSGDSEFSGEVESSNPIESYKFKNKNVSVVEGSYTKNGDIESCTVENLRSQKSYTVVFNSSEGIANIFLNGKKLRVGYTGDSLYSVLEESDEGEAFTEIGEFLDYRYEKAIAKDRKLKQQKESIPINTQLESISKITADDISDVLKKVDLSNEKVVDAVIHRLENYYDSKGLYLIPDLFSKDENGIKISLGERRAVNSKGSTFDFKNHSIVIDKKGNITLNDPLGNRMKKLNSIKMSEVKTEIESAKPIKPLEKPFGLLKVEDLLGLKDMLRKNLNLTLLESTVKEENGVIKFTVDHLGTKVDIAFNGEVIKIGDEEVKIASLSGPLPSKPLLATLVTLDGKYNTGTV